MAGAVMSSLGSSAARGTKSMAHSMGRSLYAGNPKGGGGGMGGSGTNRFSQTTSLNEKTPDGNSKTAREYLNGRYQQGQDTGLNYMIKKEESAGRKAAEARKGEDERNKDPDYRAAMAELDRDYPGMRDEKNPEDADYRAAMAEVNREYPGKNAGEHKEA
jgi:hypothetical protein